MDEHIILTREEAFALLDLLWEAYAALLGGLQQVEAMQLLEAIEMVERRIWG